LDRPVQIGQPDPPAHLPAQHENLMIRKIAFSTSSRPFDLKGMAKADSTIQISASITP
jgi:hypothetical protein